MIIDEKFIDKIFNLKIILTNTKDKIKLSKYTEQIPMYDIYSSSIYPVNKKNLHHRLIESSYRFINNEIKEWIQNQYKKNKDKKLKKMIDIINNYDIDTLIETSYNTLYKYSSILGLSVSICKKNSFNPYIKYLKPYYSKLELIKLGMNMGVIKNEIDIEDLLDQDVHYNVCKTISGNDVSYEEIDSHKNHIINLNCISWIVYFSFQGSFIINKYLRKNSLMPSFIQKGHNIISNVINKAPVLNNSYNIYRFIWDDSFIVNMKVGDIFTDKGYISTTRDPFYSPGLNGNFGLILVKIKIPKNIKGIGLFIENFSLFPKEEELTLPPNTKLKLLSRDENFKYYHINPEFEKLINRKYEFVLENTNKNIINSIDNIEDIYIDIKTIEIDGFDRFDIIQKFIKNSNNDNIICILLDSIQYDLHWSWFDSSSSSSYENMYYNKLKDGMMLTIYDDNAYPVISIEVGKDLVVNYLNRIYYHNKKENLTTKYLDIILEIGRIFNYSKALIYNNFTNFSELSDSSFAYLFHYDSTLYNYIKTKTKYLDSPYTVYPNGYWYLDNFLKKKPDNMSNIPIIKETNADLIVHIIENNFDLYQTLISNYMNTIDEVIFKNCNVIYNIYERLVYEKRVSGFKPNIVYASDSNMGDEYNLIFKQPIRRY
jgi:hypothetical protein